MIEFIPTEYDRAPDGLINDVRDRDAVISALLAEVTRLRIASGAAHEQKWRPVAELPEKLEGVTWFGKWVTPAFWDKSFSMSGSPPPPANQGWTHFWIETPCPAPPPLDEQKAQTGLTSTAKSQILRPVFADYSRSNEAISLSPYKVDPALLDRIASDPAFKKIADIGQELRDGWRKQLAESYAYAAEHGYESVTVTIAGKEAVCFPVHRNAVAPREKAIRAPVSPPMQIVTKGCWWRPDEETTADELLKAAPSSAGKTTTAGGGR